MNGRSGSMRLLDFQLVDLICSNERPGSAKCGCSHINFDCQMFKLFKQKSAAEGDKLYRITLHVGRGINTEMPANLIGAYVPVFVGANGHEAAALKAVAEVRSRGFTFIDIADGQIHELDPYQWHAFVMEAWADFVTEFPTQSKVIETLRTNFVFIGPYASYEAQTP